MRKMPRYIWECQIGGTNELDGWSAEHCVVFLTDKSSVFNGFLKDVVNVLLRYGARTEEDKAEMEKQKKSKNALLVYR